MEVSRIENLPPPPGIINSIRAGFDIVAAHITAILLPLALNLFMWLGPRLRVDELFSSFLVTAVPIWQRSGIPEQDIQRVVDLFERVIPSLNLFWLLRTLPIGISSLLLPKGTSATPLGDPVVLQAGVFSLPVWFFLLTVLGWIGGALYFRSVAWLAVPGGGHSVRVFNAMFQTVLISIVCLVLLMGLGFPLFLMLAALMQFNAFLGNLFVLIVSLGSTWVIVPLFFWPHGVFVSRQDAFASIASSIQLARFTLPTSSFFVLAVFLLAYGLNFLWRIPENGSWLTLFGIFGHSFVTTALLAASFIYYRDMQAWLKEVMEKLRPANEIKQA